MPEKKFTDEALIQAIAEGVTTRAFALSVSCSERVVRRRKAALIARGYSPEHGMTHIVPEGMKAKGVSTLYNSEGGITAQWVKSELAEADKLAHLKEVTTEILSDIPAYAPLHAAEPHDYNDTLAVYPLGDPHIGMLAWADECGEDWDLAIAEGTFKKMSDIIISKAPRSQKAMLINLGDLLHYDNMNGMTSRSRNILDTDGRYPKMVAVATRVIIAMINSLLQYHNEVIVDIVRGNHDDIGSIWLNELLNNLYEKEPRITLVKGHGPCHYVEFGKVLIGTHHGHTIKMDQLPMIMAADQPEAWGRTRHRYWLTGHIHHDSKLKRSGQEMVGCEVESFRTLAAKDAYATWGGWRSKRDTKCIVYHRELGEIEKYTASIDALKAQCTTK